MSCGACGKRRQGRIVPVNPNAGPKSAERVVNPNSARARGNVLRKVLRYTGR